MRRRQVPQERKIDFYYDFAIFEAHFSNLRASNDENFCGSSTISSAVRETPSRLRGCLCVVCIIKIIIDSIIIVCLDVINQSWTALYGKLSSKWTEPQLSKLICRSFKHFWIVSPSITYVSQSNWSSKRRSCLTLVIRIQI